MARVDADRTPPTGARSRRGSGSTGGAPGWTRWPVPALLAGGLAASVALLAVLVANESASVEAELARRAARPALAVRQAIEREATTLTALEALARLPNALRREELRSILSDVASGRAALLAADWVPRVAADKLRAYEEAQWLDGLPGYEVVEATSSTGAQPVSARKEYFPLHVGFSSSVRLEGLTTSAGSDLGAVPALRAVLEIARTSGEIAASGPFEIASEDGKPGILVFAPVFRRVAAYEARTMRTGDLLGFYVGVFSIPTLFADLLSPAERTYFDAELLDAAAPAGRRVLWSSGQRSVATANVVMALRDLIGDNDFRWSTTIDVAGRRWAWSAIATPHFVGTNVGAFPWFSFAMAVSLTLAGTGIYQSRRRQRYDVWRLKRDVEEERRQANERLSQLTDQLERERGDRQRVDDSLFREKQQFRLMFNAVPAMIWYKDTKNRFLLVNEAAAAWMGHTVDEVEGKPCAEIFPDRAYDYYRDDLEIIRTRKPKLGVIEEYDGEDGDKRWIRTDKLPEYDAMGRVVRILVFAQDISEARSAEGEVRRLNEQLEQRVADRTAELAAANAELESFAYSVSHDLRAPLRGIDGFSQLLIDECGEQLDESGREYIDRVRSASQRMGALIDDLLKLTRVSRSELSRETVDLTALARVVVSELEHANPDTRTEIVVGDTPLAKGDPILLMNVLQNLLGNAYKFSQRSEEPRIEFGSFDGDDGTPTYFVRDNGVGFDMVYANKLFGAFQRLHGAAEFEGSGIGLATVQLILRRHGGQVWAEGEPNKGATFYFTL